MAQITLTLGTIGNSTYTSEESGHAMSTAIGEDASATTYGGFAARTGRNTNTYVNLIFDCTPVPEDVVINSAVVRIKASVSSTSYLTTRTVRPWVLDDWAATAKTLTANAAVYEFDVSSYVNSSADLFQNGDSDVGIQLSVTRGTSSTSTAAYARVYGAELVIDYTPNVTHHLAVEANGHNVDPLEGGDYGEGQTVAITINESTLPKVTLDGEDITNQFEELAINQGWEGAPSGSTSTGLSSGSNYVSNAVGKTAENPWTGTNNWYGSSGETVDSQYAQYTFDTSTVPSNATNISVMCKVSGKAENSTYSHQAGGRYSVWQLFSGNTAKSEQIYTTSTNRTVVEFSNTGEWTREELNDIRLRHFVGYYGGSTNGVTLQVEFEIEGGGVESYVYHLEMNADHTIVVGGGSTQTLMVKENGEWKAVSKVFRKKFGVWTEETDVASLFGDAQSGTWSGFFRNKDN